MMAARSKRGRRPEQVTPDPELAARLASLPASPSFEAKVEALRYLRLCVAELRVTQSAEKKEVA